MIRLVSPFPQSRLSDAWTWHRGTKALSSRLGRDAWLAHFTYLLNEGGSLSWAIYINEELIGMVLLEPSLLPGEYTASDYIAHVALARKAWGKGVIQQAGEVIIPTFFRARPGAHRLSAWTSESNHPSRAVIEDLNFTLEGHLADAIERGESREALLLYGLTRKEVLRG